MNLRREIRRVRGCGARAHVQHRLLDAACLIANHCSIVTLHRGHSALSATQCNAKFASRSTRQKQYVDRLPCYIQYGRRSVRVASTILSTYRNIYLRLPVRYSYRYRRLLVPALRVSRSSFQPRTFQTRDYQRGLSIRKHALSRRLLAKFFRCFCFGKFESAYA